MYGLMIALGVLAAVELGRKRWRARGGDPDDVYVVAFWAVPAGLIGASTTVPVTIVGVDTQSNVVRFYGADQRVREIEIKKPAAQAFIKKLKAGDQVVVTFTEALAISVEPAK